MSATTINGAIEHFVKGPPASCQGALHQRGEPHRAGRVHGQGRLFPGFVPVPAARVAQAYKKSVLGCRPARSSGSMAERLTTQ